MRDDMALEQITDQMTGLQMADVIHNNFDKVLDAESAENKVENAGLSIKTDYDATRYIEMQLADGTPVKMKWDVFCQAIAPVVSGIVGLHTLYYKRKGAVLTTDELNSIFDGGDIYVAEPIAGITSRFLIQSYRYGGASCFQKAIDIDDGYKTYIRETSNSGTTWTNWKEV